MVKEAYDSIADTYHDTYCKDFYNNPYAKGDFTCYQMLLKHLSRGARILDLGCGCGKVAKYFSDLGFVTVGLDFSEGMLSHARQDYPELDFRLQDISNFNLSDKFDGAIYAYSLFHLNKNQAEDSIRCLCKVLVANAVVLFIVKTGEHDQSQTMPEPFDLSRRNFCQIYTQRSFLHLLSKHGFHVNKEEILIFEEKDKEHTLANMTMAVIATIHKL